MQRNPNLRSSLRGRRRGEFVATNYASRLASRGNLRRRFSGGDCHVACAFLAMTICGTIYQAQFLDLLQTVN